MGVIELLVRPAADAFLQVGVWVAVLVLPFTAVQHRTSGRLERHLSERRHMGPFLGAVAGVIPGCGGAIVVMPLFRRGVVTFGTVVAALVATMGDSSFVLLAADPGPAVGVHALLLATGVATGYAIDRCGIGPREGAAPQAACRPRRAWPRPRHPTSTVGAAAAPPANPYGLTARLPGPHPGVLWGLVAAGLAVASVVVFPVTTEQALTDALGINAYLAVGAGGTLASLWLLVAARVRLAAVDGATSGVSWRGVFDHAAHETAFVTAWVTVAFAVYAAAEGWLGLDVARLPLHGLGGVVIGAVVGLIPGCGPQIVLTGLYTQGLVGFPVLVTNAISQDGDALFPLIATDRRSALLASLVTTLPALAIGGLLTVAAGP